MEKFKTFDEARAYQEIGKRGYDNRCDQWSSGHRLIDAVQFSIGPVLWVIVAEDYSLGDYEESVTQYGVDASGRWAAIHDSHCSCFGWEATENDITYYDTLDILQRADPQAKVITENKSNLVDAFPFLQV